MHKILVVDDEAKIRGNICEILALKGFEAEEAPDGGKALECFARERPSAVLLDLNMPGMNGLEVLQQMRKIDPAVPVIIVTAQSDIPSAVNAVKQGAYDFLSKPPDFEDLLITLNRAVEKNALEKRVLELDEALHTSLESILGRSDAMKKILGQIKRIAASDFSVLIQGETGSGKTYLADVIHSLSRRARMPFVKVSIGSLQDSVVESELFGYEKGAFTGAAGTKKGYFEIAEGGTLFIDDLDNISPLVQSKLLSIVDDRKLLRVGNPVPVPLNIRIIGATNADLLKLVREGKFREDLFFRLSEVTLHIPPLRERLADIALFSRKFFMEACSELKVPVAGLPEETIAKLRQYQWPGNLRQLKHAMKRAALFSQDDVINPDDIETFIDLSGEMSAPDPGPPVMTMKNAEKIAIQKVMAYTGGQKTKAASILQIDYKTLVKKIREYDL